MLKKLALLPLCAFSMALPIFPQTTVNVSGYVRDLASGEELINASISHEEGTGGVSSNAYGFFSLRLPAGAVTLRVSMGGYEPVLLKLNLLRDTSIVAELSKKVEDMETVTIRTSVRRDNVRGCGAVHSAAARCEYRWRRQQRLQCARRQYGPKPDSP